MEAFIKVAGTTMPIDRPNVDTDAIIPKQFLKSIKRSGFGPNLFDEWRYLDQGEPGMDVSTRSPNPEFIMNQARYQGAQIMLARDNFGCGSSREHAVWALEDAGFKVVIAPSFADIFFNNCFKNGILPIVQPTDVVDRLFDESYATAGYALVVDLPTQKITLPDGSQYGFEVDAFRKTALLEGLDDIGQTLKVVDDIKNYERKRRESAPWLFDVIG